MTTSACHFRHLSFQPTPPPWLQSSTSNTEARTAYIALRTRAIFMRRQTYEDIANMETPTSKSRATRYIKFRINRSKQKKDSTHSIEKQENSRVNFIIRWLGHCFAARPLPKNSRRLMNLALTSVQNIGAASKIQSELPGGSCRETPHRMNDTVSIWRI